jgi:hypothetical protein
MRAITPKALDGGWKCAETARELILAAYDSSRPEPPPFGDYRPYCWDRLISDFLGPTFCEKCAFCEAKGKEYVLTALPFRPLVRCRVLSNGIAIDHPGYFWLAYESYNYVLASDECLEKARAQSRPTPDGGFTIDFPILGVVMREPTPNPADWPGILASEEPLLLDPYNLHRGGPDLTFVPDTCHVYPKTDRGRETRKLFDLNRPSLVQARKDMRDLLLRPLAGKPLEERLRAIRDDTAFSECLRVCAREPERWIR